MRLRELSIRCFGGGLLFLCLAAMAALAQAPPHTQADMVLTKHNLSVSGTGVIRALTEDRICIFCHTPHNATPRSPLWNRDIAPRIYQLYTSPTLRADPLPQPYGPTKLCLTCHDGTIAMGAVLNPAGGVAMAGSDLLAPGNHANFGLDLSSHHPVSFPYGSALPNDELQPVPPPDLVYGGTDEIHCITCHDPHNDTYGKFLLKDNRFSALCVSCHRMEGWEGSEHATSNASVVGILPRPPKTWPLYTQLNEWGCEACHTPHFAATPENLLNFTSMPPAYTCTTAGCHGSDPGSPHQAPSIGSLGDAGILPSGGRTDIGRQIRKLSAHRPIPGSTGRPAGVAWVQSGMRDVVCADCHNPHQVTRMPATAPYASGMLQGSSGVDRNGSPVRNATFEYEVCFKCHGDNAPDVEFIPRVVASTNTRAAFDPVNPSYHPVIEMGRNLDVPSIPSSLDPTMTSASVIYCTSCHADDEGGSRGPHGSMYPPILKERYETNDNTPENLQNYALCYRCHERSSILRDTSFRTRTARTTPSGGGHSGHLAGGAPCSACHDPHGISDLSQIGFGNTGSHTHLINFDKRIVGPKPGMEYPIFKDTGSFSGSCTLLCHGYLHDNAAYP